MLADCLHTVYFPPPPGSKGHRRLTQHVTYQTPQTRASASWPECSSSWTWVSSKQQSIFVNHYFFIVTQIRETLTSTAIKTNTADLGLAVNPSRWPPSAALTPLPGLCCTHTHLWKSHSSRWCCRCKKFRPRAENDLLPLSSSLYVWNSIQFYL